MRVIIVKKIKVVSVFAVLGIMLAGCNNSAHSNTSSNVAAVSQVTTTASENQSTIVGEQKISDYKGDGVASLKLPYYNVTSPVKQGDKLYFTASKDSVEKWKLQCLIEYDFNAKKYTDLYTSKCVEPTMQNVSCNENWVVWTDENNGTVEDICYMNIKSGKIETISKLDEKSIVIPSLYENYISWVQGNDIILLNLETKKKTVIGKIDESGSHNEFLSFTDNKIIWTDTVDNKGCYFVYDVDTKKTESYKTDSKYLGYPQYANGLIFSEIFENLSEERGFLGMYDIINNKQLKEMEYIMPDITRVTDDYFVYSSQGNINVYKIDGATISNTNLTELKTTQPGWTVCEDNTIIYMTSKDGQKSEIKIIELDKVLK